MIITKEHAQLLGQLKDKWSEGLPLDKLLDELNDEQLEYLEHLELAGLVTEEDGSYELTQPGHLISEALNECMAITGGHEGWSPSFKFIGSEVISMIEVARLAQGDLTHQQDIAKELERRGLAKDGRLLPVAESILEAYDLADPRIMLGTDMQEGLRKCPPGPGMKSLLPFNKEEIYRLESMRLLTFSLPKGNAYSLTGAGQQIRAALLKGLVPGGTLTEELLLAIVQDDPGESEVQALQAAGALDDQGKLLPAGRALLAAAKLLYIESIEINPSVSIREVDFSVLESIPALWDKHSVDPKIYPTTKGLKEYLESKGIDKAQCQRSLYVLESYRLIKADRIEEGKLVYDITEIGDQVLKDRQGQQMKSVSAHSVMAITTTRMENLSPDDNWIAQAEKEGLVGKGYPTKSGRLFARLACTIERLPVVDSFQRQVLDVLPYWRGMFWGQILSLVKGLEQTEIERALDRLAGNGLVDVLPGMLYKVTPAGVAFKRAMSVVPEGIEFHVTPHILRILIAAADTMENGKINWKETERSCGLDQEIINETILHMRKLMYIKSDKITNAGWLLLEGIEYLAETQLEWEEIEI